MKTCVKCGSTEFSERGDCRPCKRTYDKEYRVKKAAQISLSKKKCYEKKKEEYALKSKDYYTRNAESISEKSSAYRAANHKAVLESKKAYRTANREEIALKESAHYFANKDYISDRQRKYNLANPHIQINIQARRRSRVGDDKLSPGIFNRLFLAQGGTCNGCHKTLSDQRRYVHLDHIMPIALGGRNIDENTQLLCPKCNQTKSAKHPDEWAKTLAKHQNPETTSNISCSSPTS